MTALEELTARDQPQPCGWSTAVARGLRPGSRRRSFLAQTAVVGSALVVDPQGLRAHPGNAPTPASAARTPRPAAGYTVFCCTVNNGVNACPPGTLHRRLVEGRRLVLVLRSATATSSTATPRCSKCTTGCSGDNICDKQVLELLAAASGSTATCDQRRDCCNAFRYGQCNTQVQVQRRRAPAAWSAASRRTSGTNCTTTSLSDNATAEHNAPCLQGCGPILKKYNAMGAQGRRSGRPGVPSARWGTAGDATSATTTAASLDEGHRRTRGLRRVVHRLAARWAGRGVGSATRRRDRGKAKDGKGWLQRFEKGVTCDSPATTTTYVYGAAYPKWGTLGRETGPCWATRCTTSCAGPTAAGSSSSEHGVIWRQPRDVHDVGARRRLHHLGSARPRGRRTGLPDAGTVLRADGRSWYQQFQRGAVCDSPSTPTCAVRGWIYTRWAGHGRDQGQLGFPLENQHADKRQRGVGQRFSGGQQPGR